MLKTDTTFYDQIAWFSSEGNIPRLSMRYNNGGSFQFEKVALKSRNLTKDELEHKISDHYPLWVEFLIGDNLTSHLRERGPLTTNIRLERDDH